MNHASDGALVRARILRGTATGALAFALALGVSPLAPTATADAAVGKRHEGRQVEQMNAKPLPPRGERVLKVARDQAGDPYSWGGTGPSRFDCSGLTKYVYKKALGKNLPRTSSAQVGATKRIKRADARKGDLVFFHDGGGVYHVAIYAGKNQVWHAPGSGQSVTKATIWTGSVFFGRVR
ncbi:MULTISPECIES: C40 family peptidase [Nocardioides]|uniref:NlpC/P60 family protein n=1 Tax=Nocardioides lianchengensis TaxID=1045774 RepID=A0A1G6ZDE8_9ACTN|nr:C40 family peptidase [Nocardioides lianchengensis]NYG11424.1 cell wall-associated NlpC family hydrolase [Nocardioides lianchengensis]SDE00654.1 NlpC/P60 family protein [Nocardioides lianchengensis]